MKPAATLIILSTAIAVGYAVAFSVIYPSVTLDAAMTSLCALAGIVTALAVGGLWRLIRGTKAGS